MNAYTLGNPGILTRGIALTDGAIDLGTRWTGRPLTIPLDPRATVTCVVCGADAPNDGGRAGRHSTTDRRGDPAACHGEGLAADRLVASPGAGALLLIRDQSGTFGSWHVRAAQPAERWDAMHATLAIPNALDRILATERVRARYPHGPPVGWYEFARGQTVVTGERSAITLYGYLENGAAFEVRRRGRLDGTPSVFRVACSDGEVMVTDPRADAVARAKEK